MDDLSLRQYYLTRSFSFLALHKKQDCHCKRFIFLLQGSLKIYAYCCCSSIFFRAPGSTDSIAAAAVSSASLYSLFLNNFSDSSRLLANSALELLYLFAYWITRSVK